MRSIHAFLQRGLLLVVLTCICLPSCKKEDTPTNGGNGGQCEGEVEAARLELERALFRELNVDPDPDRPSDVDFTQAYALYQRARALCTESLEAPLGLAVTGLLALSSDAEVNAAFDEWEAYLEAHTPFEVQSSVRKPLGIPIGFSSGGEAIRLPFEVVPLSVLTYGRPGVLQDAPTIGRVQLILRDRVIPKLQEAVTQLGVVSADPSYVFTVTPRMQGDMDADPAEMDHTDILALRAGASLLLAASRIAVSYDVELAPYDSTTLHLALQRDSNWLQLASDGRTQMSSALAGIENAIDDIESSLRSLLLEIDSQDDDIIKIGPDDLSRSDVDSVLANVPNARRALNQGYTRIEDWDDDISTPDTPLKINVGNWFRDPIDNWKQLLPQYQASTERRVLDNGSCVSEQRTETISVNPTETRYYFGNVSLSRSYEGEEWFNSWGDAVITDPMEQALRAYIESIALPACLSSLYASADFGGTLEAGTQNVNMNTWVEWCDGTCVIVPVITWNADTFEEWVWPDPDMNGLLPDISTTGQLMSTFGIRAVQWEKKWVLDWTD
jgi:hypothetical protein